MMIESLYADVAGKAMTRSRRTVYQTFITELGYDIMRTYDQRIYSLYLIIAQP